MSKKKIQRAGFIPYYIEDDKAYFMLMKPSDPTYGGSQFQLAKGKVEAGETPIEGATREASEELGLKPDNVINSIYLGKFLGYTDVFYGEIKNKDDFTGTTFETDETAWMDIEEFLKVGRTIHFQIFKCFIHELVRDKHLQRNPLSGK